jgi:NADH-quinone oxidoreductase subunit E
VTSQFTTTRGMTPRASVAATMALPLSAASSLARRIAGWPMAAPQCAHLVRASLCISSAKDARVMGQMRGSSGISATSIMIRGTRTGTCRKARASWAGRLCHVPSNALSILKRDDKRRFTPYKEPRPQKFEREGIRVPMAVRRLSPDQPASFAFTPENEAWVKATIAKYPPGKQASAVIPLLWRAQEQHGGWLPEPALRLVGDMLGMAYIRVYEIATFYTMFQLSPVGRKAHVWVCGTTPCMLRGAEALVEVCRRRIHHDPHHLSPDGDFSWEEVECLGCCANAPMVQIGKDTYEDLTPELFEKVLDGYAKGQPPKPGSQIGRQASCPEGGPTTLLDYAK